MNQMKRVAVYDQFCRKQHAVLFATDIAARGLGKFTKTFCHSPYFFASFQSGIVFVCDGLVLLLPNLLENQPCNCIGTIVTYGNIPLFTARTSSGVFSWSRATARVLAE
jgi:hypothetical protein